MRRAALLAALLGGLLWAPRPVLAAPEPAAPPLNLSADNVSGTRGPEGDIVLLKGNVHITRAATVITSETGRYLRSQGMLYLDGRVRMVDSTTTLTCDHAAYAEDTDILQVVGDVTIADRDVVLRAPSGTYDRKHGRADLYGGVTAADSSQRMTCDQLAYFRDENRLEARGHVVGENTQHRTTLSADSVDYDRREHEAVARGHPVVRSRDQDGRIAELRALTLRLNSESRIVEAIDSVRVERDTLQARADYALFDDRAERGWLLGRPRAWDDETTVTGDTLEVWTEDRALRRFVVRHGASIDYVGARPDTRGETSRLAGRQVDVFFSRDAMDSLVAVGNAVDEYQSVPRAGRTPERNRAEGDTITVYFKDRKIERALVQGEASGVYRFEVAEGDTTAARNEVVRYDAPRIEFIVPKDRIVLDRHSHLTYKELELRAKRVEFDSEQQTLVATGEPKLVDRGEAVTGHLMTYDLETRSGNIYQAETAYEKGLYHGERIRKVGDNELEVMNGSYSTCDADPPHYRFSSQRMKIYLKDRLVAKPVVFYVRNVPILALPFYVFPVKPGRHSGFLFPQTTFGINNRAGQFIRNAGYYWAPNDYFDLTVAGDYYQAEPSWVVRGDLVYSLLYRLGGRVAGSYARSGADEDQRWDLAADHFQELGDRTRLAAQASFVSSRDYHRDLLFGTTLSQRLDRFLTSSVSITHNADWANLNVVLDRRQDLDADQSLDDPTAVPGQVASLASLTETVPSISVTFPTRTLGAIGFLRGTALAKPLSTVYFSLNSRYQTYHERKAFLDGAGVKQQRDVTRRAFASNASISDSRRLGGWLNLSPAFTTNVVVFDHDRLGQTFVPTGTWSGSLTSSTTLYGGFHPRLGPLVGLRHVVFPSISFSYSPEFQQLTFVDAAGLRQNRFEGFGGIGISGFKNAFLSFSLGQRLQAKIKRGDVVQTLDNLLTWNLNSSYNFLWREQRLKHPLSNINSAVRLQPPGLLSADVNWVTDIYSERPVRSLGFNVSLGLRGRSGGRTTRSGTPELPLDRRQSQYQDQDFSEPWSLSLAYSSSGGYASGNRWSSNRVLNGVAHYGLTRSWRMDYSASYDATGHQIVTQRFGLTRDLHCWQASFTRTFNPGSEAEYYFRLGIKDQREIYLERGTRETSFGGIR